MGVRLVLTVTAYVPETTDGHETTSGKLCSSPLLPVTESATSVPSIWPLEKFTAAFGARRLPSTWNPLMESDVAWL